MRGRWRRGPGHRRGRPPRWRFPGGAGRQEGAPVDGGWVVLSSAPGAAERPIRRERAGSYRGERMGDAPHVGGRLPGGSGAVTGPLPRPKIPGVFSMRVRRFAHLHLPACKRSVGQAGRALAALVPAGDVADNKKLLVSEAVVNAVEHTDSDQVRGPSTTTTPPANSSAPSGTAAPTPPLPPERPIRTPRTAAACTSSTRSRTPGATSPTATANGSGSVSPPQREPDGPSLPQAVRSLPGRHRGRHHEDSAAGRPGRGVPLQAEPMGPAYGRHPPARRVPGARVCGHRTARAAMSSLSFPPL